MILALVAADIVARFYVKRRFTAEEIAVLTMNTPFRGRYMKDDKLPYVLRPLYDSHNSMGWKGKEFSIAREPGRKRVICVGTSTTYGGTHPYPEWLEGFLVRAGLQVEVLNAGVPGWTSRELLIDFRERVLPLEPDLIVLYEGRNDLIPQAYNRFKPDYSHFRDPKGDFTRSHYWFKTLFKVSRLSLMVVVAKPKLFGWDLAREHPVYATVQWSNLPSPAEMAINLEDPARTQSFRSNIDSLVVLARSQGIEVLIATFAFIPERMTADFLPFDWPVVEPLRHQMGRNNAALRTIANARSVHLLELHQFAIEHPDVFIDDCHVTDTGDSLRATAFTQYILENRLLQ